MADDGLTAQSYQHLTQLGLSRLIDASAGPTGPRGVVSYHLVPTNGYHNGQRLPHDVHEDLKDQSYDTREIEGVEYYLIPEVSTNIPGQLSHYAQLTGVAELQNPPGNGVNRVRETLTDYTDATVAPEAVSKYVDDNDAFEEARKKKSDEDEQLAHAINRAPAREPSEGRLEVVEGADSASESGNASSSSSTKKSAPATPPTSTPATPSE